MKLVITNDFSLMLSMMGDKPFLSVDIRKGRSDDKEFLTASVFPSGQIFMTPIEDNDIKFLLSNILKDSENNCIFNIILDMQTLPSDIHKRISSLLSEEFKGIDTTVFITENEEDKNKSSFIDDYAANIYDQFIDGLNYGATLINLPDIDFFDEKRSLVLNEKFVPRYVPGFLSCFLILGAKDFSPQLYRMIKRENGQVFFEWDRSFKDYIEKGP